MAVSSIIQGSQPKGEVPPQVSEFFLAKEFSWTLHYIRSLDHRDVDIMTTLIGVMYRIMGQGKDIWSANK